MPAFIARILIVFFSIPFISSADAAGASKLLPDQNSGIPRTIFFSYTLENRTAQTLNDVQFLSVAPVKKTSYQHCTNMRASLPHTIQTDAAGNQILRFVFDIIPPHARKVIAVHAQVFQKDKPGWPMPMDPSMHLSPARYIEAGHEEILRRARSLVDATPMKTAEKIYQFVSEHVRYSGFSSGELGALYALRQGKGDCTESTYLFVALCRAAGLPARGIGGYMLTGSSVLRPSRYHNWAEFHDGEVWQMADPQRRVFAASQSAYIAMRVLNGSPEQQTASFHRFCAGDDRVKVTMNE